jgi:hypothetical protein
MKITFVVADTWATTARLQHENEYVPYKKRTVQVELNHEQMEKLKLRKVGDRYGSSVFEEILDCFIESDPGF